MKFNIRLLYLYLFSFIGLLVAVIGTVRLVDLGLKVYVFHNADTFMVTAPMLAPDGKVASVSSDYQRQSEIQQKEENTRQRQRTTAEALSMIIVGVPLYLYHWRMIKNGTK
jgi:hypothetical protein